MAKMMDKKALAKLYGVHSKTLYRWFKRNSKLKHLTESSQRLCPRDLDLIRDVLGDWGED